MMRKVASGTEQVVMPSPAPIQRTLGELRFHTDGDVLALVFAEDAIWSVEEPGVLRHWNAATGQQRGWVFLSDVETLWSFSTDGRLLASASDELSFWEVSSGRLMTALSQPSWVTALAFAGRRYLATGHDDGLVRLWDVAERQLLREIPGRGSPVSSVGFTPDGALLAVAAEDRLISLFQTESGRHLGDFVGHTDRIQALAFHPLRPILVSAGWDTTARVWNTTTFEPIILLNAHANQVTALAFSPDGNILACADSDNVLHIWDPVNGKSRAVFREHEDEIRCLAFSPDSQRLASGGADHVIHLWDPRQNLQLSNRGSPLLQRASLTLSPDGILLASTCGGARLQVWNTASGQNVLELEGVEAPQVVTFSPDGKWLAGGGSDQQIRLWRADDGRLHRVLDGQKGRVAALAFAADSRLLASASASDGLVWVWNLDTGEPCLVIPEAADNCLIESLAFHPNGKLLAVGGIDWLATGGSDGAIGLWDVVAPAPVHTFDGGTASLSFHPSGRWLAAASLDETICVWDLDAKELAHELTGHNDAVTCVAFSPDGRWLVSGSDDRTLRLWDAAAGEAVAVHAFDTQIKALCFSPDGRALFTGNGNTTSYQLEVARLLGDAGNY